MNNVKVERWNHSFIREISNIVNMELQDETIRFVTITDCEITSDYSHAKVYFTVLEEAKKEEIEKALNKASAHIRSQLCQRIEIRHTPQLKFVYDTSIDYGRKIEDKIKEIHENDE